MVAFGCEDRIRPLGSLGSSYGLTHRLLGIGRPWPKWMIRLPAALILSALFNMASLS